MFSWSFVGVDPTGAAQMRRALAVVLREAGLTDATVEVAELVYGELLSNVVRHACGPIEVRVVCLADGVRLSVEDAGPPFTFESAELPEGLSEGGRGLYIVRSVARSVHVEPTEHGKRVTAEVAAA